MDGASIVSVAARRARGQGGTSTWGRWVTRMRPLTNAVRDFPVVSVIAFCTVIPRESGKPFVGVSCASCVGRAGMACVWRILILVVSSARQLARNTVIVRVVD